MEECLLGSEWKQGEPLVKVYGTISKKEGENSFFLMNQVSSILLNTVTEFSINQEESKNRKDTIRFSPS